MRTAKECWKRHLVDETCEVQEVMPSFKGETLNTKVSCHCGNGASLNSRLGCSGVIMGTFRGAAAEFAHKHNL